MLKTSKLFGLLIIILYSVMVPESWIAHSMELPEGVRPLFTTKEDRLVSHIPNDTIFLNDSATIQHFLEQLEKAPPDWTYLYGTNVDERYDRLFDEMEKRDEARAAHPMLRQRIAFIWYGNLTSYRPEHLGFGVAIGPLKIQTRWGIVRFKIAHAPFEMVAVPSKERLQSIQEKRARGEDVEIQIMYTGRLMEAESVLYDFSTDKEGEGMIMPIVMLDKLDYIMSE